MGADYTVGGLFVNWPILDCRTLAQIRSQVRLCRVGLRFAKIREILGVPLTDTSMSRRCGLQKRVALKRIQSTRLGPLFLCMSLPQNRRALFG